MNIILYCKGEELMSPHVEDEKQQLSTHNLEKKIQKILFLSFTLYNIQLIFSIISRRHKEKDKLAVSLKLHNENMYIKTAKFHMFTHTHTHVAFVNLCCLLLFVIISHDYYYYNFNFHLLLQLKYVSKFY